MDTIREILIRYNILNTRTNTPQLGDNYWETINEILSNLSTAQLGAIGHILLSVGIVYSVMNIASGYYGDKLITYFNLERKYPRLAKLIKYRRIYQEYNIAFNLILIWCIACYIIFVNVSVFKYL